MGWNDLIGMQLDQYEILSELGRGGSSRVYQARDTELNRDFAIKVIPNDADDRELFLDRFHREVEAVQQLHHINIVGVYGAGVNDEFVYLVMQCVTGGTLRQRLNGPLPVSEATSYVVQIAYALQHAHEKGIIHRDVKPSNMLLEYQGSNHVLLTDFGIAKIQGARGLTKSGTTIGTPEYMSPEQCEGRDIDERSDIYSLGCVLYETLAGRPPFRGSTALSVLFQQVHSRPAYIRGFNPSVPPDLVNVLETALAKRSEERYPTAEEFAQALLPFADALPATVQQPPEHGPIVITQSRGLTQSQPLTKEQRLLANDVADRDTVQNPYLAAQSPLVDETTAPLPAFSDRKTSPPFSHLYRPTSTSHRRKTNPPSFGQHSQAATPPSRLRKTLPPLVRIRRASGMNGLSLVVHSSEAEEAAAPALGSMSQPGVGYGQAGPTSQPQRPSTPRSPAPQAFGSDIADAPTAPQQPVTKTSGRTPKSKPLPDSRIPATWPRARRRRFLPTLVAAIVVLLVFGVLALDVTGYPLPFKLPFGSAAVKATTTATQAPTATTVPTSTATTAPTGTAGPKPTATTSPQQILNQQASASFRSVTLGTFGDGSCSASNAQNTFSSGQAIYVSLCTSGNAISAPMTVTIRQGGNILYTMVYGRYISPGSSYFYYTTHPFASGSYDVVVTLNINGSTGIARDLALTIR